MILPKASKASAEKRFFNTHDQESRSRVLTIVVDMLVKHFHPQNTANLRQRLEVVDVNDVRPKGVVENRAETFHVRSQLDALNAEELAEQTVLVLTDVDQECARRAG